MKYFTLSFIFLLAAAFSAGAEPTDTTAEINYQALIDSAEKSLNWQKGKINIAGVANLNVPEGFRYLGAEQSRYVLEKLWDNLEDDKVLGMLFPDDKGPFDDDCWAYVVTFETMGYVKDDDADDIDYDEMAVQLKESSKSENEERLKHNLPTLDFVGWAEKPSYDKDKKVLYWAKEFKVSGSETNTLNYDIRILGRKGVLSMNAVAGMPNLDEIKASSPKILSSVEFTEGNRYADFDSNVDEVAAWTIGGLVAGKVLAKAGFFALIVKFIKPIILGVIALGGAIFGIFRKKKKEAEVPVAADSETGGTPGE